MATQIGASAHHSIAVFISKIFSSATQRLSGLTQANFHEKALFVKADVAA
jgi:hypothetical protein